MNDTINARVVENDTPETNEKEWPIWPPNTRGEMFVVPSDFARKLERERDEAREISRRSSIDWAEDHTYLQNLCRQAGASEQEVEGDSYGVPGIIELSDLLFRFLGEAREELRSALQDRHDFHWAYKDTKSELEEVKNAILSCLEKNGHLADGEDCTLIELKRALR